MKIPVLSLLNIDTIISRFEDVTMFVLLETFSSRLFSEKLICSCKFIYPWIDYLLSIVDKK